MPFYVCFYHVIWATKYRQPIITPQIETVIFEKILDKSKRFKCQLHAINTAYDHIHVAITIPPAVAVAEWVREVKGLSAHEVNREFPNLDSIFKWQKGYSVLTFGKKRLSFVVNYIKKQKEHHADGKLIDYLEYLEDE